MWNRTNRLLIPRGQGPVNIPTRWGLLCTRCGVRGQSVRRYPKVSETLCRTCRTFRDGKAAR